MKTIEQASKEIFPNPDSNQITAFELGVEFAQRWILVEEELPPREDEDFLEDYSIDILLKNNDVIVTGYYDFDLRKFEVYGKGYEKEVFTHYRIIDLQ